MKKKLIIVAYLLAIVGANLFMTSIGVVMGIKCIISMIIGAISGVALAKEERK